MSVMMHGKHHRPVIEAFVEALCSVEPDHAPSYYEYAYKMAEPAVQRILGELVASTTWPVYSPFAKEHFGRGKAEGRKEGREEGRAEGEAHAVLTVLAARGIEVPETARARIHACTDVQELEEWLKRAVVVTTVEELFG